MPEKGLRILRATGLCKAQMPEAGDFFPEWENVTIQDAEDSEESENWLFLSYLRPLQCEWYLSVLRWG